jgi:hypothetical protein
VSPPDSTEKGSFLSRFNIYTVLLGMAFLALCIACALLALELNRYNWDTKAQKAPRATWIQSPNQSPLSPAGPANLLAVGPAHHSTLMDVV